MDSGATRTFLTSASGDSTRTGNAESNALIPGTFDYFYLTCLNEGGVGVFEDYVWQKTDGMMVLLGEPSMLDNDSSYTLPTPDGNDTTYTLPKTAVYGNSDLEAGFETAVVQTIGKGGAKADIPPLTAPSLWSRAVNLFPWWIMMP